MKSPTTRKISDNPFFIMPLCPSPRHHTPPAQAGIAANASRTPVDGWDVGQYEHTCLDCGNITRFSVSENEGRCYHEFSSAILGGASYGMGSTEKEIEASKVSALDFLREQAALRRAVKEKGVEESTISNSGSTPVAGETLTIANALRRHGWYRDTIVDTLVWTAGRASYPDAEAALAIARRQARQRRVEELLYAFVQSLSGQRKVLVVTPNDIKGAIRGAEDIEEELSKLDDDGGCQSSRLKQVLGEIGKTAQQDIPPDCEGGITEESIRLQQVAEQMLDETVPR